MPVSASLPGELARMRQIGQLRLGIGFRSVVGTLVAIQVFEVDLALSADGEFVE